MSMLHTYVLHFVTNNVSQFNLNLKSEHVYKQASLFVPAES